MIKYIGTDSKKEKLKNKTIVGDLTFDSSDNVIGQFVKLKVKQHTSDSLTELNFTADTTNVIIDCGELS